MPPTTSPPPLAAPVASTLPPRDTHHTPSATTTNHPSDAPASTPSTTDPTPTTPHPTQTAVAGPPAGSSKPETDGQPRATRHDQAEIPPERPAKPDAPATMQAGGSSHGSAGSQGAAHLVAAPAAPLDAAEPALQLTREQLQEVVGIVSSQHPGTAAGPSGWTFEMICAACKSSDAALDVTLELVQPILSGELPRQAFLMDGLLIRLEKPGGGLRPIAINETWYRVAGVCALRTYVRGIGARFATLQVGVGTAGGTETVAHALASALAEDPETVVISVDMANAFNSIYRTAMFAAVQQSAPALLPTVQWAYGDETPLHIVGAPEALLPSCQSVVCDRATPWVRCCSHSRCSQC